MTQQTARREAPQFAMNYLISLAIGIVVGLFYGALDFRLPAPPPPLVALVGLLGMQAGEKLWPLSRDLFVSLQP